VDQTLKVLGLKRCEKTVVGNALLRGISGGEKKRLTTAEMMGKAWPSLLFVCSTKFGVQHNGYRQCVAGNPYGAPHLRQLHGGSRVIVRLLSAMSRESPS
jgi:hypothetical protein